MPRIVLFERAVIYLPHEPAGVELENHEQALAAQREGLTVKVLTTSGWQVAMFNDVYEWFAWFAEGNRARASQ
jgi:hypothetical protein